MIFLKSCIIIDKDELESANNFARSLGCTGDAFYTALGKNGEITHYLSDWRMNEYQFEQMKSKYKNTYSKRQEALIDTRLEILKD